MNHYSPHHVAGFTLIVILAAVLGLVTAESNTGLCGHTSKRQVTSLTLPASSQEKAMPAEISLPTTDLTR